MVTSEIGRADGVVGGDAKFTPLKAPLLLRLHSSIFHAGISSNTMGPLFLNVSLVFLLRFLVF